MQRANGSAMPHRDPSPKNNPDDVRPDDEGEFTLADEAADEPVEQPAPRAPLDALEDDDADYELEAPDETIDETRRRRAAQDLEEAQESIDIDQIYREEQGAEYSGDELALRFQFRIKHLMILTAAVAIALSLAQFTNGFTALFVLVLFALAGAHAYFSWVERKRLEEVGARREAMYERHRARAAGGARPATEAELKADAELAEAVDEQRVRVSFSTRDLLIAMSVAAVVLGLGSLVSFSGLAAVLGFLAIAGLVVYGVGYDPPPAVVTVWWVTLALYIVISVLHAAGAFSQA